MWHSKPQTICAHSLAPHVIQCVAIYRNPCCEVVLVLTLMEVSAEGTFAYSKDQDTPPPLFQEEGG